MSFAFTPQKARVIVIATVPPTPGYPMMNKDLVLRCNFNSKMKLDNNTILGLIKVVEQWLPTF